MSVPIIRGNTAPYIEMSLEELRRTLESGFRPTSRILDQFGRPIYPAGPGSKMGDTIKVQLPKRFCERAPR